MQVKCTLYINKIEMQKQSIFYNNLLTDNYTSNEESPCMNLVEKPNIQVFPVLMYTVSQQKLVHCLVFCRV